MLSASSSKQDLVIQKFKKTDKIEKLDKFDKIERVRVVQENSTPKQLIKTDQDY